MLRSRRDANGGHADPLPVEEAIAYVLEILPAIGHLHDRRLLFCDFKPDNVIRTERSVKLIDLGGAYRMDDDSSPIYGTIGFQAPEIAHTGPTVASDIFTVGRTLAVLCTDFPGYHSHHRYTLADPGDVPLYQEFDSLYRLLERATAPDPDDRFQTAAEMSTQLLGVLREITAVRSGSPSPGPSTLFAARGRVPTDGPVGQALPRLVVDPDDRGAGTILALGNLDPHDVLQSLDAHEPASVEIDLWRIRALIDIGELDAAEQRLVAVEADDPWAWRAWWYRGVIALERRSGIAAIRHFDAVYRTLPGELGPKVALGFANEIAGDLDRATRWYQIVARTDPAFTVASFGLARCRAALGDREGAVDALGAVPDTSNDHLDASSTSVELLVSPTFGGVVLPRRAPRGRHRRSCRLRPGRPRPVPGTGARGGTRPPARPSRHGRSRHPGVRRSLYRALVACRPRGDLPVDGSARTDPCRAHRTRRPRQLDPPAEPPVSTDLGLVCPSCAAEVFADDEFCEVCGVAVAEPRDRARDHEETDVGTAAGVTDRGLVHARNDDAMYVRVGAFGGSDRTVVVVCDGVSTSAAPQVAAQLAADTIGRSLMAGNSSTDAFAGADEKVRELSWTEVTGRSAPSCTAVAAVVEPATIHVAWTGDSRAYWITPDRSGATDRGPFVGPGTDRCR